MGYYSIYSNNYGGYNYSLRWLVLLLPLILPYALAALEAARGAWRAAGLAAAWLSAVMALAAWPNPWLPSHTEALDLMAGFKLWAARLGWF